MVVSAVQRPVFITVSVIFQKCVHMILLLVIGFSAVGHHLFRVVDIVIISSVRDDLILIRIRGYLLQSVLIHKIHDHLFAQHLVKILLCHMKIMRKLIFLAHGSLASDLSVDRDQPEKGFIIPQKLCLIIVLPHKGACQDPVNRMRVSLLEIGKQQIIMRRHQILFYKVVKIHKSLRFIVSSFQGTSSYSRGRKEVCHRRGHRTSHT